METVNNKKLYEGMFLVDSALATSDWDGVNTTIKTMLDRAEAEIVSMQKWDERRLAYDIGGKSRGTYILCYFRADGGRVGDIERDVQLSERIVRVLILNADSMSQENIEKDTPVMLAEKQPAATVREHGGREMSVGEPAAGGTGKSETEPATGGPQRGDGTAGGGQPATTVREHDGKAEDAEDMEPAAGGEDTSEEKPPG